MAPRDDLEEGKLHHPPARQWLMHRGLTTAVILLLTAGLFVVSSKGRVPDEHMADEPSTAAVHRKVESSESEPFTISKVWATRYPHTASELHALMLLDTKEDGTPKYTKEELGQVFKHTALGSLFTTKQHNYDMTPYTAHAIGTGACCWRSNTSLPYILAGIVHTIYTFGADPALVPYDKDDTCGMRKHMRGLVTPELEELLFEWLNLYGHGPHNECFEALATFAESEYVTKRDKETLQLTLCDTIQPHLMAVMPLSWNWKRRDHVANQAMLRMGRAWSPLGEELVKVSMAMTNDIFDVEKTYGLDFFHGINPPNQPPAYTEKAIKAGLPDRIDDVRAEAQSIVPPIWDHHHADVPLYWPKQVEMAKRQRVKECREFNENLKSLGKPEATRIFAEAIRAAIADMNGWCPDL